MPLSNHFLINLPPSTVNAHFRPNKNNLKAHLSHLSNRACKVLGFRNFFKSKL